MPFADPQSHLTRKRRWQDDDEDAIHGLYSSDHPGDIIFLHHQNQSAPWPRKVVPLSKRTKTLNGSLSCSSAYNPTSDEEPAPSRRRKHTTPNAFADDRPLSGRLLLAPCHICHRKPTKKVQLDSYADCQGCGERTCFVCIRQCQEAAIGREHDITLATHNISSASFETGDCTGDHATIPKFVANHNYKAQATTQASSNGIRQEGQSAQDTKGWHAQGHRTVICSRCCIERGAEGDVVCLGCLSTLEGL